MQFRTLRSCGELVRKIAFSLKDILTLAQVSVPEVKASLSGGSNSEAAKVHFNISFVSKQVNEI